MDNSETSNFRDQRNKPSNKNWTLYLILCCITVSTGSLQFGYNIGSLNSPTELIKDFIKNETFLFETYHQKKQLFELNEMYLKGNETRLRNGKLEYEKRKEEYIMSLFSLDLAYKQMLEERKIAKEKEVREKFNMTIEEYFAYATKSLNEKKEKLEGYRIKLAEGHDKVVRVTDMIWTLLNCLFVVGGMIGAFTSKFVLDFLGRKKGLLFHNIFSIIGGVLVLISIWVKSPVCILVSRFLFGVQGGMSCTLVPTYLSEISPSNLRGQTGVIHQLCITIGILIAQLLGFRQLLGADGLWNYLLAMPLVPAVLGGLLLLIFFPETPRALLIDHEDKEAARRALRLLRNSVDVNDDIDEIYQETNNQSNSDKTITIGQLFTLQELRWPLITSFVLQIGQQLCGVNAVFFYSQSIFKGANIPDDYIQYAIASTGIVNVFTTVICVKLIDRLGRKPLLVFPMIVMILDFIALTVFLAMKDQVPIFSYLSIACFVIFVICFAVGLGPIPFLYTAEVFRQNARSSAMAICILTNWISSLLLTLFFPFFQNLLQQYVFLIFLVIVFIVLIIIWRKVPETKGKTVDEIIDLFNR